MKKRISRAKNIIKFFFIKNKKEDIYKRVKNYPFYFLLPTNISEYFLLKLPEISGGASRHYVRKKR